MEHRWGKRSPVNVAVTMHPGSGAAFRGRIANLSLSGALVLTEVRLPAFSQVIVELKEGLCSECEPALVTAYVAREAHAGLGLEWTEFRPSAIAKLLSRATARLPAVVEQPSQHHDRLRSPAGGRRYERRFWR